MIRCREVRKSPRLLDIWSIQLLYEVDYFQTLLQTLCRRTAISFLPHYLLQDNLLEH